MTEKEAGMIVERLKNGCVYHRFDEPGVYAEYIRALVKYDYRRIDKAVDVVLEEDSQRVPPISAIVKEYKKLTEENRSGVITPHNEQYCEVCDDKGFVLMTEEYKGNKYQFVLYCPFCAVGQSHAYDGSEISKKEHRSEYVCEPLTKYFDEQVIEQMRQRNRERKIRRDEREGIKMENAGVGR